MKGWKPKSTKKKGILHTAQYIYTQLHWIVPSLNNELRAPKPIQPNITKRNMKAHSNICANISPEQMLFLVCFFFGITLVDVVVVVVAANVFYYFLCTGGALLLLIIFFFFFFLFFVEFHRHFERVFDHLFVVGSDWIFRSIRFRRLEILKKSGIFWPKNFHDLVRRLPVDISGFVTIEFYLILYFFMMANAIFEISHIWLNPISKAWKRKSSNVFIVFVLMYRPRS